MSVTAPIPGTLATAAPVSMFVCFLKHFVSSMWCHAKSNVCNYLTLPEPDIGAALECREGHEKDVQHRAPVLDAGTDEQEEGDAFT